MYKAANAGREVAFVNPKYTTQIYSGCGTVRQKELEERWHSCECGCELDRDTNAAINILRKHAGAEVFHRFLCVGSLSKPLPPSRHGVLHAFFSLRNACTVVPQTEQIPFMACLPFFMVTS
jgi:transposase